MVCVPPGERQTANRHSSAAACRGLSYGKSREATHRPINFRRQVARDG